jgi:hypothetical protein
MELVKKQREGTEKYSYEHELQSEGCKPLQSFGSLYFSHIAHIQHSDAWVMGNVDYEIYAQSAWNESLWKRQWKSDHIHKDKSCPCA